MIDFKAQILEDLKVFHNPREFAAVTALWYGGKKYNIPVVLEHETTEKREQLSDDHAPGIHKIDAKAYISYPDLGIVPKMGRKIEIKEGNEVKLYEIVKSSHEDGEIILELGAYED